MTQAEPVTGKMVVTLLRQMQAIWAIMPAGNRIIFPALAAAGLGMIIWPALVGSALPDRGFALGLLGVVVVVFTLFLPTLNAISYLGLTQEQKQVTYAIDAKRIVRRDAAGTEVAVPWSSVRWCRENSLGLTLSMRPLGAIWLPRQAFSTDAFGSLRELAKSNLGKSAKLSKDG